MKATTITPNPLSLRQEDHVVTAIPAQVDATYIHDCRKAPPIRLTPRQLEVLALLCEGLPNKLISRRLDISAATVKCHIGTILGEMRVSSRLQAVVLASRLGLVRDVEPGADQADCSVVPPEVQGVLSKPTMASRTRTITHVRARH
jgi:DNA-binding CsgD family transcriptional regulator